MTFTDDDLKRLKDCIEPENDSLWVGLFNRKTGSTEKINLRSLLNRVEAGEHIVIYAQEVISKGDSKVWDQLNDHWRKACGK